MSSVFIEKLISKKKTAYDYVATAGLFMLGLIILYFAMSFTLLLSFLPLIAVLVLYGLYLFIKHNNVEFEYSVLNGEIDIDKITGKSRRKRMLSASCREFDVFGKFDGPEHTMEIAQIPNKLFAVTSIHDPGVYFFVVQNEGKKYVIYFQPDDRMLQNFIMYNPLVMRNITVGDNA